MTLHFRLLRQNPDYPVIAGTALDVNRHPLPRHSSPLWYCLVCYFVGFFFFFSLSAKLVTTSFCGSHAFSLFFSPVIVLACVRVCVCVCVRMCVREIERDFENSSIIFHWHRSHHNFHTTFFFFFPPSTPPIHERLSFAGTDCTMLAATRYICPQSHLLFSGFICFEAYLVDLASEM